MADEQNKIVHPGVKDSRVMVYLNLVEGPLYTNTLEENYLLNLWRQKYYIAKAEYEKSRCGPKQVSIWRNAYEGKFNTLNEFGEFTNEKMNAIRKIGDERVESKVNSHVPTP